MRDKNKRFELRLDDQEDEALRNLAESKQVSRSEVVADYIRRAAKRLKLWPTS